MIKARYSPATEDLVAQLMSNEVTGSYEMDSAISNWAAAQVIDALRRHGYNISIEVEVTGDMEKAFESLGGDTFNYVKMERPKRKT